MRRVLRNIPSLVAAALLVAFFFYCAGFGLFIHLGYDDIMNTTFAWDPPLHSLLLALLSPFTTFYRPTGSALYRLMFAIFGLRPEPFRVVTYALLVCNLWLVYRLVGKLSHSKEVAAMSVLLYSFHGRLAPIYLNNGTVYDVLCGTFSLLTILYYLKAREAGKYLTWREWLIYPALFILALNAKEMAAAIPLLLICYEFIYHRHRQVAPSIVGIAIVVSAAIAKMSTGSVMYANPYYKMTITPDQFAGHWRRLLTDLVYAKGRGLTGFEATAICISVVLIVIVMRRRRYVVFFAAIALLGPLPVIFIPFRGFFVMYFPLVGWATLVAAFLVEGRNWLWHRVWHRPALPDNVFEPERIILFAFVAFFIVSVTRHDPGSPRISTDAGQVVITEMRNDILSLNEPLPRHARVLFLHDRFPPDAWGTVMLAQLMYDDRSLEADRPTMMQKAPDESSYDRVFDYVDGRLAVVRRRPATATGEPQLLYYPAR